MKAKYIIGGIALIVAASAIWTASKINELKGVFAQMGIRPQGWPKNFKINTQQISFKMDFRIYNPSQVEFSVPGASLATLKRISVFKGTTFIGQADMAFSGIPIPAGSFIDVKDVQFNMPLGNLLDNVILSADSLDPEQLKIEAIIEVLGNNYTVQG